MSKTFLLQVFQFSRTILIQTSTLAKVQFQSQKTVLALVHS